MSAAIVIAPLATFVCGILGGIGIAENNKTIVVLAGIGGAAFAALAGAAA